MTIDPMLTQPEPAADLIGRVLQEAGIEYVFGISGAIPAASSAASADIRTRFGWSLSGKSRWPA